MKVLVTSDLHLSTKIWKHRPIEGDSLYAWKQIVSLAKKHEVDLVILAGDVLDKQTNTSEPVAWLTRGLHALHDAGIEVWFTQGQHEMQSQPWASIADTAIHLDGKSAVIGAANVAGRDFCNEEQLSTFLNSDIARKANILVMHQVWLEFMGEECKPQGSFADLPRNVDTLITGDYHEHIAQYFDVNGRKLAVYSPGSTHLRSISEPQDKYVFIWDVEKRKAESVPLRSRRLIDLDASKFSDFAELRKRIKSELALCESYAREQSLPDALKKPLLRITYLKDHAEEVSKLDSDFNTKAHMFFKVVKTHKPEDLEPQLISYIDSEDRVSMLGALDNYVDKTKEPEVFSLASTLLNSDEPMLSLMSWLKEKTNESK